MNDDKSEWDKDWTRQQLRSLVDAMQNRSIVDAEVDYFDGSPQKDFQNQQQDEQTLPTGKTK